MCTFLTMYLVAIIPHVQSTLLCPVVDSLQAFFGTRYFKRSLDENRGALLLFSQPRYSTPTLPFLWRLFIQIKRRNPGLGTLLSLLAILDFYTPHPPPTPPLPSHKRLLRRTCRKCGNLSLGSILRNIKKKKICQAWRKLACKYSLLTWLPVAGDIWRNGFPFLKGKALWKRLRELGMKVDFDRLCQGNFWHNLSLRAYNIHLFPEKNIANIIWTFD